MAAKGDMVYAWTSDADIAKKAECGGAVTGLLKFALENKIVDAVLAVKKGADLYDAVPVLSPTPKTSPILPDRCTAGLCCSQRR